MTEIYKKIESIIKDLKENIEIVNSYDFWENRGAKTIELSNFIIEDEKGENLDIIISYKDKEGKDCRFFSFKQNEENLKKIAKILNKHGCLKISKENNTYFFKGFRMNFIIN